MLIQSDAAHTKTSSNPHKPLKFNNLHFKLITGSRLWVSIVIPSGSVGGLVASWGLGGWHSALAVWRDASDCPARFGYRSGGAVGLVVTLRRRMTFQMGPPNAGMAA